MKSGYIKMMNEWQQVKLYPHQKRILTEMFKNNYPAEYLDEMLNRCKSCGGDLDISSEDCCPEYLEILNADNCRQVTR